MSGPGLIESAPFDSGRPLPVVRNDHASGFPTFPKSVLIAWDGTAKAARAVADALDLHHRRREG